MLGTNQSGKLFSRTSSICLWFLGDPIYNCRSQMTRQELEKLPVLSRSVAPTCSAGSIALQILTYNIYS